MKDSESLVFAKAISPENVKTLESAFPSELVRAIDINAMAAFERNARSRLREMMVAANTPTQRLFRIAEEAASLLADARALLDGGSVAAVDGTDAMEQVTFNMTSAYACAVGHVTSKERGKPAIKFTTTSTEYADKDKFRSGLGELAALCDELERSRIEQSWPTTFREYEERKEALECDASWVFLDGPVFTQNLVTQEAGRDLYKQLASSPQHFIGVIKDLSGSWVLSKWCGSALEPGEGFVVDTVRAQFEIRFEKRGQGSLRKWMDETPIDYVRVVFRPGQKVFGLECRVGDIPMAMALVTADASPTINHELPLLLETIDAHMRASCRASELRAAVISKIQQDDYRTGIDLISERDFR